MFKRRKLAFVVFHSSSLTPFLKKAIVAEPDGEVLLSDFSPTTHQLLEVKFSE